MAPSDPVSIVFNKYSKLILPEQGRLIVLRIISSSFDEQKEISSAEIEFEQ
jgi:hypothetical protein